MTDVPKALEAPKEFPDVKPGTPLPWRWKPGKDTEQGAIRSGADAIDIITYNGAEKVKDREYVAAFFDECHRLPANTFSRLSTVRAKYAIGLSATPYREDGRTPYILALTGYPVGMDWTEFFRSGVVTKPEVAVTDAPIVPALATRTSTP